MKCIYIKPDKLPCQANAMKDSKFCFRHNPDTEEQRFLASQKGGKQATDDVAVLPEMTIETSTDVKKLLIDTVNRVRTGELDIRRANTIGYLAGHLTKAIEVSDLEEKVRRLERALQG